LWLGSANATQRGWDGPNTELVARASVSAELGRGLEEFVQSVGRIADLSTLAAHEDDSDTLKLEEARRQLVARWEVVARYRDGRLVLDSVRPPHPDDLTARLDVGLIGRHLTEWPRGVASLSLGAVSGAELTEFVQCRVTLGELSAMWIQRAPLDPPLDAERDRLALARYLDPRTFLLWIRSLLTLDGLNDGGGDWNATAADSHAAGARLDGPVWWAPTLEEVLRAWSRDPASVIEVDRKVRAYLELVGENPDAPLTETELGVVDEFRKTWAVLRGELLRGGS
jgi:hypothetical protein